MTSNGENVTLDVTLDDLSDSEIDVYNLIKTNSKITRDEIAIKLGKAVRTVQRITNSLVIKGYILRMGNNRFGYWEVLK